MNTQKLKELMQRIHSATKGCFPILSPGDFAAVSAYIRELERERDELRLEIARIGGATAIEVLRRDAAAGECAGVVTGYAVNGYVVIGNKLSIGDHVYTAAQLAVLPPKLSMDIDPELQGEFRVHEAIRRKGFNQALDAALELGAQQQNNVQLPMPFDVVINLTRACGDIEYRYHESGEHFDRDEILAVLNAANVKWEVKK